MKDNNNIERRSYKTEFRDIDGDSRHVEGYAIVFNSDSRDKGFIETIDPTAIDNDLINSCDVFCYLNHDEDKPLARSNQGVGNLKLTIDDNGLKYEFDALQNDLGDSLLEYLRTGMINESSFAFTTGLNDGDDEWFHTPDGKIHRTIHKIDYLYDVSPVFTAAYAATSVSKRSEDNLEKEKQQVELEKKLNELKDKIKNY